MKYDSKPGLVKHEPNSELVKYDPEPELVIYEPEAELVKYEPKPKSEDDYYNTIKAEVLEEDPLAGY